MDGARFSVRSRLADADVYYGWFVVVACLFTSTVTFGIIFSFSVFFGHIAEEFGQSYASTSVIFGLQSVVTYGGAGILGFAIDRYGVRPLLVVATVLLGSGLLGASQFTTFLGVLLSYGIVAAVGLAITMVVAYTVASRWFERRRGLAVGMATSGTNVGVLAFPPLASLLIARYGWQRAYFLLMVLIVCLLVVALLLFADWPTDLPVDVGAEFVDGAPDPDQAPLAEQARDVLAVATSRSFLLIFAGWVCIYTPLYVTLVYVVEYAGTAGIGREAGVLAVSVIGASAFGSRYLAGYVSDRWETLPMLGICAASLGLAPILMGLVPVSTALLGFAVLFGFGYGGTGALLSPLLTEIYGSLNLGSLFGLAAASFAVAGSLMPYLAGIGYEVFGSFSLVFVGAGAVGILGALVTVVVGRRALAAR